eukprot:scaffold36983_cov67-Phaeocystis_antarctica.AAC.2
MKCQHYTRIMQTGMSSKEHCSGRSSIWTVSTSSRSSRLLSLSAVAIIPIKATPGERRIELEETSGPVVFVDERLSRRAIVAALSDGFLGAGSRRSATFRIAASTTAPLFSRSASFIR